MTLDQLLELARDEKYPPGLNETNAEEPYDVPEELRDMRAAKARTLFWHDDETHFSDRNPDHVEPVTLRENIMRGEGLCAINARKDRCPRGHLFTPENTRLAGRHRRRRCRICLRARKRAARRAP